jgi:outer membrane protein assembly factor BamB
MFRKQSIMKDISSCFSLNQNTVVMSDKNGIIWLNNKEVFQGEEYLFATIRKEDFFVFGNSEKIFSGKISEQNFKATDSKGISWGTYSENGVVVCRNKILDEKATAFKGDAYYLNFKTGKEQLLFEQEFGGILFTFENDTKALYRRLTTLKSLSLATGEYLWEVSLSAYGRQDSHLGWVEASIRTIIGISEDLLLVWMNNGSLVAIEVSTGKIAWDKALDRTYLPSDYQGDKWYWHLEGQYLYILQHRYYLRIDITTQKLEVLWQLPDHSMEIEHCIYTEAYVYFMALEGVGRNLQPSILGVFDRKALKIVWQHDQPIYSSQPPQSDGNKLYCLDTAGTLHIFEREKSNP